MTDEKGQSTPRSNSNFTVSPYVPSSISLDDLTDVVLPKLKADGVLPGIFFTPERKGLTPSVEEFMSALEAELQRY